LGWGLREHLAIADTREGQRLDCLLWGSGLRVQGLGVRLCGSGLGYRVWGLGFKVKRSCATCMSSRAVSTCQVEGTRFRVHALGFMI
jgi:hypothetical protein